MTVAPTIKGRGLRLRAHRIEDMAAFEAFYGSPRAAHMDVPVNRTHLWYGFASEAGSWSLCGYGGWTIEVEGALAGQVALTQPPHFPELELGWMVFDGFEGRSIAYEAASLARDYSFDAIGAETFVSCIDRKNLRSIALAERLGATVDPLAETYDDADIVYRHRRAA
ncbi:MAG: GNAT family N-acetyltransferase [Pseudomonadota bacterium]